jgi:hypothetical protein
MLRLAPHFGRRRGISVGIISDDDLRHHRPHTPQDRHRVTPFFSRKSLAGETRATGPGPAAGSGVVPSVTRRHGPSRRIAAHLRTIDRAAVCAAVPSVATGPPAAPQSPRVEHELGNRACRTEIPPARRLSLLPIRTDHIWTPTGKSQGLFSSASACEFSRERLPPLSGQCQTVPITRHCWRKKKPSRGHGRLRMLLQDRAADLTIAQHASR